MADRLSDRLTESDVDSDSDSLFVSGSTVEIETLTDGRRLVVRRENGVFNLYLQVRRNAVDQWETVRILSAGNAYNPLQ